MSDNVMITEEWAKIIAAATELGATDGRAAATWVFDGNTSDETWTEARRALDEGDPAAWDAYSSPLSGEWADGLTPTALMEQLGVEDATDEATDEACTAYEQAHSEAWADEIDRAIAAHFEDEAGA